MFFYVFILPSLEVFFSNGYSTGRVTFREGHIQVKSGAASFCSYLLGMREIFPKLTPISVRVIHEASLVRNISYEHPPAQANYWQRYNECQELIKNLSNATFQVFFPLTKQHNLYSEQDKAELRRTKSSLDPKVDNVGNQSTQSMATKNHGQKYNNLVASFKSR